MNKKPLLTIKEARWACAQALYDCLEFGFDSSVWGQILTDLCGEGINGIKVHL